MRLWPAYVRLYLSDSDFDLLTDFKIILKYSVLNISPSKYIQHVFAKYNINSIYIPNYLNIDLYPYYKRKIFNPRLLWVRSLHKIYNPKMAIDTLKIIQTKYPTCHLCMVGPDKDNSLFKIKKLIQYWKKFHSTSRF